jgi:hypothetical protein
LGADLQWEATAQANVDDDFEGFQSRLRGSFDVYRKKKCSLFPSWPPLSSINHNNIYQ